MSVARGVLFADYVFEPAYKLQSIEDHAGSMWKNKHLPAMSPRREDTDGRELIELGGHTRGLLEELEKAHIYITQLNERIKEREQRFGLLEAENARLAERLSRLEALLAPKGER